MLNALLDRFWAKVPDRPDEGCWLWRGARYKKGYGKISEGGRSRHTLSAHRVSWELYNGPIPAGMKVLHRCDNPPCVRPDHLFLGTTSDNHRDAVSKGRWGDRANRGVKNGMAKLDDNKVRIIRQRASEGQSLLSLSREFGVSWPVIDDIVKVRKWKHVA